MRLITASFFDKARHEGKIISIANSAPAHAHIDSTWKTVVPPWRIVKGFKSGEMGWTKYELEYTTMLNVHESSILSVMEKHRNQDITATLCCWEKDNANCHRRLLAEWLIKHGYEVEVY